MKFSRFTPALLVMLISITGGAKEAATEPPQQASPEQIQKWIKLLGAETFGDREEAEAKLKTAGPGAIAPLQEAMKSGDVEIKVRGQRIVDALGWSVLPDVTDLAKIFPAETILLIHTPGLKKSVSRLRADSTAGKLYDSEAFGLIKDLVGELTVKVGKMSDANQQKVLTWMDRFGGPTGIALITIDTTQRWGSEAASAVFGVNAQDRTKAFQEYAESFPIHTWGNTQILQGKYRGVSYSYRSGEYARDAMAPIKNVIVRASSELAMKKTIDGIAAGKNPGNRKTLADTPEYNAAASKLAVNPLASLYFNYVHLLEASGQQLSPRERQGLSGLGFDALKYCAVSLDVREDGLIREKAYVKLEGERKGLGKLLDMQASSSKHAQLCPTGALGFISLPFDGKMIYDTILAMAEKIDQNDTERFKKEIEIIEKVLEFSVSNDLLAAAKGEAALWVLKPSGPNPAQLPEVQTVFGATDAEAAQLLADRISKLTGHLLGKDEVKKADYKGRSCFWFTIKEGQQSFTFSWCADADRVLAATSQSGLQTLINRVDAKLPGLEEAPDFKQLLAAVPAEERGGMIYVNTAAALTWGYQVGLPLAGTLFPEDQSATLKKAPKDLASIIKDLPGTLFSITGNSEGLKAQSVGGIPVTGLFCSMPFLFVVKRQARRAERAAARVRAVGQ